MYLEGDPRKPWEGNEEVRQGEEGSQHKYISEQAPLRQRGPSPGGNPQELRSIPRDVPPQRMLQAGQRVLRDDGVAVIAPAAVGRGEEKSLRTRKAVFMQGSAERAPDQELSSNFTQMGKLGQVTFLLWASDFVICKERRWGE